MLIIASQDEIGDLLLNIVTAAEWQAAWIADGLLPFWVVTYNSLQYPGVYVARPWTAVAHGNGGAPIEPLCYNAILIAPTLDVIRTLLPRGMTCAAREKHDPAEIVERWFA